MNLQALLEPGSGLTGPMMLAFDINDRGEITGSVDTPRGSTEQIIHGHGRGARRNLAAVARIRDRDRTHLA